MNSHVNHIKVRLKKMKNHPYLEKHKIIKIEVKNNYYRTVTIERIFFVYKEGVTGSIAVYKDVKPEEEETIEVTVPDCLLKNCDAIGVAYSISGEVLLKL